jgi:hypothetical protein
MPLGSRCTFNSTAARYQIDFCHCVIQQPVHRAHLQVSQAPHKRLQDDFRLADGHENLVKLLKEAANPDLAHRILLMLQVLADKEADRKALLACGAADAVKPYVSETHSPEVLCS